MPFILAIESTCDETAAAVFTDEPVILSSVVSSQADLHARYGGVVPEIAARAHVGQILPVIDEALTRAGITLRDVNAVAVAYTPGLVGAILVGVSAAKGICLAHDLPLIGVNHLEGHVYACQMIVKEPVFPCVGLVVSGGHTHLFHCKSPRALELIGATIDDAAGEAFDKVASILGLGYPGGPEIEKAARDGDRRAYRFPRSLLDQDNLDFSFSGLKTSVLYTVRGQNSRAATRTLTDSEVADLAASFQEAVVEVLVEKARRAARQCGLRTICVGGGVAANGALRVRFEEMSKKHSIRVIMAPPSLCTDNAAMAAVAVERFRLGDFDCWDLDAQPGVFRKA